MAELPFPNTLKLIEFWRESILTDSHSTLLVTKKFFVEGGLAPNIVPLNEFWFAKFLSIFWSVRQPFQQKIIIKSICFFLTSGWREAWYFPIPKISFLVWSVTLQIHIFRAIIFPWVRGLQASKWVSILHTFGSSRLLHWNR